MTARAAYCRDAILTESERILAEEEADRPVTWGPTSLVREVDPEEKTGSGGQQDPVESP